MKKLPMNETLKSARRKYTDEEFDKEFDKALKLAAKDYEEEIEELLLLLPPDHNPFSLKFRIKMWFIFQREKFLCLFR